MFQYAAGLALAERRRTVLKLDVSWYREYAEVEAHNRYALSCFNITEQFATADEIERYRPQNFTRTQRWLLAAAQAGGFYDYVRRHRRPDRRHRPPTFAYYPDFADLPRRTYLAGYFQSEKFFAPIADQIRLHFSFRYPPQPEVAALAERIRSGPSAAIHFRRGDYARNPNYTCRFGVIGYDYYARAVSLLRERSPEATLYIFSTISRRSPSSSIHPNPTSSLTVSAPRTPLTISGSCRSAIT